MKVTLSDSQIDYLNNKLIESGYSVFTQKFVFEIQEYLQLSWLQIKRRALNRGIIYKQGFLYSEIYEGISSKAIICFKCNACQIEYKILYSKLLSRNYDNKYCGKCYIKFVTNSEVWKKKNSEAQKIAQNRSDVKEKNRNAQIKRHQNPEVKEHYRNLGKNLWKNKEYSNNISKKILLKWKNKDYADSVLKKNKWLYQGYFENIFYQSLCELSFILNMFYEKRNIKRYDAEAISYVDQNGIEHSYYPDFIVDHFNIIEIKGKKNGTYMSTDDVELISLKKDAAETKFLNTLYNYRIIYIFEQTKLLPINFYKLAKKVHNGKINKENLSSTYGFCF